MLTGGMVALRSCIPTPVPYVPAYLPLLCAGTRGPCGYSVTSSQCDCPPGLCRSDRERSTLQVKLKSAQRALTESLNAPHPKSQGQEEGALKQGGEGNLPGLSALSEQEVIHKLKSRVYELENEVCVCVRMCSFGVLWRVCVGVFVQILHVWFVACCYVAPY